MWNLVFLFNGLLFISLLVCIFLSKEVVNTKENKVFKWIALFNLFGYISEISLQIAIRGLGANDVVSIVLSKIYLIMIFIWFTIFSIYTFIIGLNKENKKKYNKQFTKQIVINILIGLVGSVFMYLLPIEIFFDGSRMYSYGVAVDVLKLFLGIYMFTWIGILIFNIKNIKNKKFIPMFVVIGLLIINVILQTIDPSILISTMVGTFICYTMYFTIENPDVKLLEEFKIAKDRAEKANKEKEMFLYNITEDIRLPLYDVKKAANWISNNVDEIDKKSIKDGMAYINTNASNVLNKVNNILDVTNMEITNIKVYDTKYDIKLLLDELYKIYSDKVAPSVDFKFKIDTNIPGMLNGDSLRLKQLLTIILDNACKYTNKGYVRLKLNTIVKKNICRLIITIEDTGIGIKASDIDNIFNKNNQNYNSLDKIDDSKKNLAIAKSIATLLGGILLLESEIGEGTEVTLVLDQKIYEEKSDSLVKIENDITSYISKKKVMVISEDSYLEEVSKALSKYDIDIIKIDLAAKGLEHVRLNRECDLIIMDENLKHLTSLEVLNKFKDISGFNIPVAILTDNTSNKEYINDGFNYVLNRKLDKTELDSLINGIE